MSKIKNNSEQEVARRIKIFLEDDEMPVYWKNKFLKHFKSIGKLDETGAEIIATAYQYELEKNEYEIQQLEEDLRFVQSIKEHETRNHETNLAWEEAHEAHEQNRQYVEEATQVAVYLNNKKQLEEQ